MDWIGNFNFIQDSWIQEVLNTAGQARPRDWPASSAVESAEYAKAKEAGYDLNAVHWWVYEKNDVSFDIVDLPFIKGDYHWWITKLYPGQFMPIHTDICSPLAPGRPKTMRRGHPAGSFFGIKSAHPAHRVMCV